MVTVSRATSDRELHSLVKRAINEANGETSPQAWRKLKLSDGPLLFNLYNEVAKREKNGRNFLGYGSWDNYLEQHQGVVPLVQKSWSTERVHSTFAKLLSRYPPENSSWHNKTEPILYGKSLSRFYYLAHKSNGKSYERSFFGHGSWKNYVAWVRENYK